MFNSHMPPTILLPRESFPLNIRRPWITTCRYSTKVPLRRLMHIINMSPDILGSLKASTTMLTSVWVCVGFLMSTEVLGLLARVTGLNMEWCKRGRDALVLVVLGKCPGTPKDRARKHGDLGGSRRWGYGSRNRDRVVGRWLDWKGSVEAIGWWKRLSKK
jgi:hypothetical protein